MERALPADIAIFAAAVADWRVAEAGNHKIKKGGDGPPRLALTENPDILSTIAHRSKERPRLVIGFAAETNDLEANARAKLMRKGCDWIVGNDVSGDIMGGGENEVLLATRNGVEHWPRMGKGEVAFRLASRIAEAFADPEDAARIDAAE